MTNKTDKLKHDSIGNGMTWSNKLELILGIQRNNLSVLQLEEGEDKNALAQLIQVRALVNNYSN